MMRFPEQHRAHKGQKWADRIKESLLTDPGIPGGAFFIPREQTLKGLFYFCIASSGNGWEHVSVSIPSERRCPTWEEMCYINSLFWEEEDCVVQYHPRKSKYVNNHPHTLHLWRPLEEQLPEPDPIFVGVK